MQPTQTLEEIARENELRRMPLKDYKMGDLPLYIEHQKRITQNNIDRVLKKASIQ